MWWIEPSSRGGGPRPRLALLSGAALVCVCALGGCTSLSPSAGVEAPLTPTEQYSIQVDRTPDQLALAAHPRGLSEAQRSALASFADRWREAGRPEISVQAPAGTSDPAAVSRTADEALATLRSMGVPQTMTRLTGYDAGGSPTAPILASFTRYQARGPDCQGGWDNVTSTGQNNPMAHFGCATVANLAAQIADPRDLVRPHAEDPADAGRRETVLGKYRRGETTSTARDDQAAGSISTAVGK